jgi:hypothetical protein
LPSLSSWGGDGGRDDDDGGQKGGQGTRQGRGYKDAKAIGYDAAGGRGNEAIDNRIILITNNQTLALIFFASFLHDTKVTSTTNEI